MSKYHIIKASRCYSGHPYDGPSCDRIGIDLAESDTYSGAYDIALQLSRVNPVGWVIVDSETGEICNGTD